MCLITFKDYNVTPLSNTKFKNSLNNNIDGTGIMYPNGDGSMTVEKCLGTRQEQIDFYREHKDACDIMAVHQRFTTHGFTDMENCHPFQILSVEEHGVDLYMMHNGVIDTVDIHAGMSDTWHFVEYMVKPILAAKPCPIGDGESLLNDTDFISFLESNIGGSKLLFMDGWGDVTIVNEGDGKYVDGCWLSSAWYVNPPYQSRTTSFGGYNGFQDDYYGDDFYEKEWEGYNYAGVHTEVPKIEDKTDEPVVEKPISPPFDIIEVYADAISTGSIQDIENLLWEDDAPTIAEAIYVAVNG